MIFEVLATVCFGTLCADHVLPTPRAMDAATCETQAGDVAQNWSANTPNHTARDARCVALSDLGARAADVVETAPGHFVHFGKIEDIGIGSNGDVANTGFVIGQDRVAVIDSGTTRFVAEALYLAVRQRTDKPIEWLFLTHMHPDHVLGAAVFAEAGAQVAASALMAPALEARADIYMASMERLLGPKQIHATVPILPNVGLGQARDFDLGGRVLRTMIYPTAHTNNDLTVLDLTSGTLWTGDLAFMEHTPALDGSINGWITVLEQLVAQSFDAVVPGHGRQLARHPDGLRPTLDYLLALRTDTRAALAKGESLNTAIKHLGAELGQGWALFEAFNPRNATNAYVELEWE
ncbi:MAG: quinoprotein relay system zinc metallohydrolase 2 [Sedimentitalea sp.]